MAEQASSPKRTNDLEALLSPPEIELSSPDIQITRAEMEHPVYQKLQSGEQLDDFQQYSLAVRAESFRLESQLHRLLCHTTHHLPSDFDYIDAGIRKSILKLHGRVLYAHEPGLDNMLGLTLQTQEYLLRGIVHRVLFLAPPSLLGYWENMLNTGLTERFEKRSEIPQEDEKIPARLLLNSEHFEQALPSSFLEMGKFQLIVVAQAEGLKRRRSRPWKNLLSLSPDKMLLHVDVPFEEKPAELHGYLALLGVPELPPAARLKRELGSSDDQAITLETRQTLRPFLEASVLRNTHPTTPIQWAERQWETIQHPPHSAFQRAYKPIKSWLSSQIQAQKDEEAQEETYDTPLHRLLSPLMQATSAISTQTALLRLANQPALQEHQKQLQDWAKTIAETIHSDPRIPELKQLLRNYPNLRLLIFCEDLETVEQLTSALKTEKRVVLSELQTEYLTEKKLPGPNESVVMLVTDDSIPTAFSGPFDVVIHFDFPWNPEQMDIRSHWLLSQQQERTRHIYTMVAENSPESHYLEALDFRLKLATLLPEELATITRNLSKQNQLPQARWRGLEMTATAFADSLSKPLLEARKQYRQRRDLNQRLFLDDYAL